MTKQFSLRFLFQVMTTLAVVCGAAMILPFWFSQLVVGAIWIVAAAVAITGVVFAKGDQRAFYIGVLVALSSMSFGPGGRFMDGVHSLINAVAPGTFSREALSWLDLAVLALLAWAMGRLCVFAKHYFERSTS